MLLSGFYGYGIWAAVWWQSLEIVLLAALLAFALWQKAADQLPYLLDPTAAPPARVSASDGLIAAMMFLVFQIVIAAIWHAIQPKLGGAALLGSFVGSGALTYGLIRLVYWRSKTEQIPRVFSGAQRSSWLIGASTGAMASVIGLIYLWVVQHFGLLADQSSNLFADPTRRYWLLALAILAAPIFEEFIFRGLIFGGLRRSMGLMPAAAASAAVFAVVHPPASIIPVFFLGLCTALAYERSRVLAAPMLTHAVYNAVVLGYQFL
jgi:membrane protease YdiL (CAAX protease family)